MTGGKFTAAAIVLAALAAGVGIWYTQTYAYHVPAPAQDQITLTTLQGGTEGLPVTDFTGIRSESSPLGFRACFKLTEPPRGFTETYDRPADRAPTIAPGWFDCFNARQIGEDLAARGAIALMGTKNIAYGVDRIVALYPDGTGYAWHQLNNCGHKAYDGTVVGEACPPRPDADTDPEPAADQDQ